MAYSERAKRRQEIGRLRLGNAENIALVEEPVPQPNGRGPQARDEVGALLGVSGRTVGNPAKLMPCGAGIPALGIPISNGARRQGTSAIRVCGQRR
jgi:hypothetical protein